MSSGAWPARGIKELRHTAASFLHAQGLSPCALMEMVGHSDVRITLNTYTDVFDENRRRAAERMDAALGAEREWDHRRAVGAEEVDPRLKKWSGRQDLNLRPPDPQIGLPRARTRTTAHTGLIPAARTYAYARTRRSAHWRKGPRKGP